MGYDMTQLEEMAAEVDHLNHDKGWFDEHRTFGDLVALLHSEASELIEAYRRWGWYDATPKPGWLDHIWPWSRRKPSKPEGVGSEAADVLIRLLDLCNRYSINLDDEFRRKMDYNWTRPYRHGGKKL